MPIPTLITFIAYLIILLGIGFCFYRRSAGIEDYLLGGRGMGSWVTAFSAQASDMSGWLLMGLPGAIYLAGIGKVWIAVGLFIGTVLNWVLVSSSALSEDFYCKAIKKQASQREIVLVGRVCVIIISVIALFLAMDRDNTIIGIVSYAWGGFGAAFGPLVLFALFSRKTSWQSALAGMVAGTVVLVLWKQIGLSDKMYEIVPGFAANCLTIIIVNLIIGQKDEHFLQELDDFINEIRTVFQRG